MSCNPSIEAVIGGEPASRFVGPAPAFFVDKEGRERGTARMAANVVPNGRGSAESVVGKGIP